MLHPYPGYDRMAPADREVYTKNYQAIEAATRMLCELKQQFDIPSLSASWDKYDVLVLPDHVLLDGEVKKRVAKHLKKGGRVIASAWSGLDADKKAFVFPEWGVDYLKDDDFNPAFLAAKPELGPGFPDMPMTFYDQGVEVAAKPGANVLGTIVAPYYNRHWDGEHGFVYRRRTRMPAGQQSPRPSRWATSPTRSSPPTAIAPLSPCVAVPACLTAVAQTIALERPGSVLAQSLRPARNRRMAYFPAYVPEQRRRRNDRRANPVENQRSCRVDNRKVKSAHRALSKETRSPRKMTTSP